MTVWWIGIELLGPAFTDCLPACALSSYHKLRLHKFIDFRSYLPLDTPSQNLPAFILIMPEETSKDLVRLDGAQDSPRSKDDSPAFKMEFLSFPPEVRNMIYEYVYSGPTILLTCRWVVSTWKTHTSTILTPQPFHEFQHVDSARSMFVSINDSLGLLLACRTTYLESFGHAARLAEFHVDDKAVPKVEPNTYMPLTWMGRVRYLSLSAYPESYEFLEMRSWYPALVMLEISDFGLYHYLETSRSEIMGLSDHGLFSLFCGEPNEVEHWLRMHRVINGREPAQGPATFQALAGVELRLSRLLRHVEPDLEVYYVSSVM